MVSRSNPINTAIRNLDATLRSFGNGTEYELYEEDDEFVLAIEMPGFEREEIDLAWDDGVLNVAADHVDDARGRKKSYRRRFRFPRAVDETAIEATYANGVLEVHLPTIGREAVRGTSVEVEG